MGRALVGAASAVFLALLLSSCNLTLVRPPGADGAAPGFDAGTPTTDGGGTPSTDGGGTPSTDGGSTPSTDGGSTPTGLVAGHPAVAAFDAIPTAYFGDVRSGFNFFYGHTSHGSQIMTGIAMLEAEDAALYASPAFDEVSDDLGTLGDVTWDPITRDALDDPANDYNVVMWSWCGGVSTNDEAGIDTYLSTMAQLEIDYPDVTFVYMTGHLDGTGDAGNLRLLNDRIRSFCAANDKVLFDFEDIESYDPDGTYYADGSDACEWCTTWCSTHTCPSCSSCAHSHCFNCYRKGKAFWWMMARLAGWAG